MMGNSGPPILAAKAFGVIKRVLKFFVVILGSILISALVVLILSCFMILLSWGVRIGMMLLRECLLKT